MTTMRCVLGVFFLSALLPVGCAYDVERGRIDAAVEEDGTGTDTEPDTETDTGTGSATDENDAGDEPATGFGEECQDDADCADFQDSESAFICAIRVPFLFC